MGATDLHTPGAAGAAAATTAAAAAAPAPAALAGCTDEQLQAARHLDGQLLVAAGAGSGKTFTLTKRIVWALSPGSGEDGRPFLRSIDEALVITYTNKAAGELKGRFRTALRAAGLAADALAVDDAWVSTIHGMCHRILREHALELGLNPQFELAMEADADQARARAIERVIDGLRRSGSHEFDALFDAYQAEGVARHVRTVLAQAATQTRGLDAFHTGPKPEDPGLLARQLLEAAEALADDGTPSNQEEAAALAFSLQELLADAGADAPLDPGALAAELDGVKGSRLAGKRAKPLADLVKHAKAACQMHAQGPLLAQLLALSRRVERAYRDELAARGLLDMSDLIRTTLRAFDEHPSLAAEYQQRFRLIMVDEFQDTSQLQIDMIGRIAAPDRRNLCTVGDAQQSIYRFQGADVQVYLGFRRSASGGRAEGEAVAAEPGGTGGAIADLRPDAGAGGTAPPPACQVQLTKNFRSHPDVLAFVRRVCGQAGYFAEDFLDLQAPSSDQGKSCHGPGPRIELALTEHTRARGGAEAAAQAEARFIAQRFAQLHAQGHPLHDLVLLMGATTNVHTYAQAIRDAGLSCVVTGGSKFFQGAHVQAALCLLHVLANPYDSERLLVLLTGDILPVSPDDLLFLSTYRNQVTGLPTRQNPAAGLLLADRAPEHASPLLQHAARVLRRAWGRLGTTRPRDLFMQVAVESGWLSRLEAAGVEGAAQAADVLKFARLVGDAQRGGNDMARVASMLQRQADVGTEKPGALSTDSSEAVRIMTVHSSKGLEFPVVAVANCYSARARSTTPAMVADGGLVLCSLPPSGFSGPAVEPDAFDGAHLPPDPATFASWIKALNAQREYEERKRLFYVAATRASDRLIVCVKHERTKANEYKQVEGDLLRGLCPDADDFPLQDGPIDYGGSEPLAFTRLAVSDGDAEAAAAGATGGGAAAAGAAGGGAAGAAAAGAAAADPPTIAVPEPTDDTPLPPTRPVNDRDGIFSYTSLAASHDDVAAALEAPSPVGAHSCAPRSAQPQTSAESGPEDRGRDDLAQRRRETHPDARNASGDEDAAFPSRAADPDKATAFGSALHQACEWWALQRDPAARPPLERIARTWSVHDLTRLQAAFDRWAASDTCALALEFPVRHPELPFAAQAPGGVDGPGGPGGPDGPGGPGGVLEGEIDLFCTDGKGRAFIVDYKTGGHASETPDALRAKHLLQAQCYAYATLQAGYREVDLHFVRVEQPDPARPDHPQIVRYHFDTADLPALAAGIAG